MSRKISHYDGVTYRHCGDIKYKGMVETIAAVPSNTCKMTQIFDIKKTVCFLYIAVENTGRLEKVPQE